VQVESRSERRRGAGSGRLLAANRSTKQRGSVTPHRRRSSPHSALARRKRRSWSSP